MIASAFVFLVLRRLKRNGESPAVPREDVDEIRNVLNAGEEIQQGL